MIWTPEYLLFAISLVTAAVAACWDLAKGIIPNWLALAGLLLGVLFNVGIALSRGVAHLPAALLSSILGLLVCSLVPLALYYFRSIGGGDLKLLAVIGASLGPALGVEVQVAAFTFASIYAFGRAAWDGTLWDTTKQSMELLARPLTPKFLRRTEPAMAMPALRFAPAVFGAVLVTTLAHVSFQ